MKYFISLILCCSLFLPCTAQNWGAHAKKSPIEKTTKTQKVTPKHDVKSHNQKKNVEKEKKTNITPAPTSVQSSAAVMPCFPGGDMALMNFLKTNIVYPEKAISDKIEGTVMVQFIIETTGKVSYARIVRSISPELDEEALRVVGLLPDWIPARHENGENVAIWYTIPVRFKLPK